MACFWGEHSEMVFECHTEYLYQCEMKQFTKQTAENCWKSGHSG